MVFFYLVTAGWIFDISLRENSINQSINTVVHCFRMVLVVVCTTCISLLQSLFWCPCMAINVSVQYNGGLLPDNILLT